MVDLGSIGAGRPGYVKLAPSFNVSPTNTTVVALQENPARQYAIIVNQSGNTGWVEIGATAANGQGIPLLPFGSYEMSPFFGNLDTRQITVYGNGTFSVKEA